MISGSGCENIRRVVVIGGGITGLSAAFYARNMLREQGVAVQVTLVERDERLGGKINTTHRDGFVIEKGPDSFLARKLPIIELTRELGLENELTGINPNGRQSYIMRRGKLHPMPAGFVLGIPTKLGPMMKTGLLSLGGKLRAAGDFVLPRGTGVEDGASRGTEDGEASRNADSDESLGGFLRRRLGREVVRNIAEPLLAGIYAGDLDTLSLRATFPQFREIEQKHRSLILGMMRSRSNTIPAASNVPDIARRSVFLTYKQGLGTLVDALSESLRDGVEVRTGIGIVSLRQVRNGDYDRAEGGYELSLSDGSVLEADAVVITVPTFQAANLLPELSAVSALGDMPYISVANVVLAYERKDIGHPLEGSGFVAPRGEGLTITACTWTSSKWLHTAPPGKALIRCYVGRAGEQEHLKWEDDTIVSKVRDDLRRTMGIDAMPLFTEVTRLNQSMPQYPVGHLDRIDEARRQLGKSMPGIFITGAGFHGVGIPDCIRQSKEAASQVIAFLRTSLD